MLEQLVNCGDSLFDRDGGAPLFLNGAGAQGAGRASETAGASEIDEGFDLVGLAAESEQEHGGKIGMRGVTDKDTAEEIGWFAVFCHTAAGAVGDCDDTIDVGVSTENLRREVGGDAARDGGRAVDSREDADIVAGGDAAVGSDNALKRCGYVDQWCGLGFGADGVIAVKIAGDQIVAVNEFADRDGLGGKTNDLIELTDRLTGGDGVNRQLMAGSDVHARSQVQAVEGLARRNRLKGNHNVVRASEFESVVAQTIPFISDRPLSELLRRNYWYDHTLLQLHNKRIVLLSPDIWPMPSAPGGKASHSDSKLLIT